MNDPNQIDPSFRFGQQDGLFIYNMARSLDGSSQRPDQTISILAEDAVRTALRFRSNEGLPTQDINIELAKLGLMAVLKGNFEVENKEK
jgi:hypothetical protein